MSADGCCAPSRADGPVDAAGVSASSARSAAAAPSLELVPIAAGTFRMGAVGPEAYWDDGEGPIHVVELSPYRIAARSSNTPDSSTGNLGFRIAAHGSGDRPAFVADRAVAAATSHD